MLIYKDGTIADHKIIFKNISFPEYGPSDTFLRENDAYRVNIFKPHNKETQKLVPCDPYIEDDLAYTVEVIDKTESELEADLEVKKTQIRNHRNMLLKECDWTQGRDISEDIYIPWGEYRDLLRNVPQQESFPHNVIWPVPPGENNVNID